MIVKIASVVVMLCVVRNAACTVLPSTIEVLRVETCRRNLILCTDILTQGHTVLLSMVNSLERGQAETRSQSRHRKPPDCPTKYLRSRSNIKPVDSMAIDDGDERVPQILYGESASLTNEPSAYVLKVTVPCACWKTDDEVEFDHAPGHVFITDSQVLFQCSQTQDHSVAIDAECIVLHAQSDDQVLYLQLQEDPSNDSEVMELTLTVTTSDECERLFQALSHLISQHPVYGDEDDDGMMGDYGEDMVVAPDEHGSSQQQLLPTEEERNAMLDRLDAMLVIPPHLQDNNNTYEEAGQFDDADDDIL
jgi:hypothetical protein